MASPSVPSATNAFVPSHEATGGLLVKYSRNREDFPVNRCIQMFEMDKPLGLYAAFSSRNAARILTDDDAEHLWADNDAAPVGFGNLESFQYYPVQTQRRAYPFSVGRITSGSASWDVILNESRDRAQQAMTARTMLVHAALTGAAWGSNTATAEAILGSGNDWSNGSSGIGTEKNPHIRHCLQFGARQVALATLGQVKGSKALKLLTNVYTAQRASRSPEVMQYIRESPYSLEQLMGNAPWLNRDYDVPDAIYGYEWVVEDAVRVTSPKGAASDVLTFVMADRVAYLMATAGTIEGAPGSRSFSTVQFFWYEDEMTAETFYDAPNRRTTGRVVSNYRPVVPSTYSGFKFTEVVPAQ